MYSLFSATQKVFTDGRAYLNALPDADYSRPLECLSGATIGQHTRHWIEFFQCLFWQIRDDENRICYDERQRDLQLETDAAFALSTLDSLHELMGTLNTERALNLQTRVGTEQITCATSVGREWWYAVEHAIHHLAIVKIALRQVFQHLELPADFGLAFSTKQHREQRKISS